MCPRENVPITLPLIMKKGGKGKEVWCVVLSVLLRHFGEQLQWISRIGGLLYILYEFDEEHLATEPATAIPQQRRLPVLIYWFQAICRWFRCQINRDLIRIPIIVLHTWANINTHTHTLATAMGAVNQPFNYASNVRAEWNERDSNWYYFPFN